jgi:hypothetical protein
MLPSRIEFASILPDKENLLNEAAVNAPTIKLNEKLFGSFSKQEHYSPSPRRRSLFVESHHSPLRTLSPNEQPSPSRMLLSHCHRRTLTPKRSPKQSLSPSQVQNESSSQSEHVIKPSIASNASIDSHKPKAPPQWDEYGFDINEQRSTVADRRIDFDPYLRNPKSYLWSCICAEWNLSWFRESRKFGSALTNAILEGFPDAPDDPYRRWVWLWLLEVPSLCPDFSLDNQSIPSKTYCTLLSQPDTSSCALIRLDLHRTFGFHQWFANGAPGQQHLFNVLKAYSVYKPSIGYCQGMGFIAGGFLMTLRHEEAAFWCFVSLMERVMGRYFQPQMQALIDDTNVFDELVHIALPALHRHCQLHHLEMIMLTSRWFLSLFTDLREWRTLLRLWDIIICVGRPALFAIALSILKVCEPTLLRMSSLDQMLPQLLNLASPLLTYSKLLPALRSFDISSLLARAERDCRKRANLQRSVASRSSKRKSSSLFQSLLRAFTPVPKRRRVTPERDDTSEPRHTTTAHSSTLQKPPPSSVVQKNSVLLRLSRRQASPIKKRSYLSSPTISRRDHSKAAVRTCLLPHLNSTDSERKAFMEFSTPKTAKEHKKQEKTNSPFSFQPQYNFVSLDDWTIELSPLHNRPVLQ